MRFGHMSRKMCAGRGFVCSFQYDDDEEPCMAICKDVRNPPPGHPVHLIHLRDLWKYNDDGFLWRAAGEMVNNLTGSYSRFEHNNLFFFVNDCLQYLLEQKPFPESEWKRPELEVEQTGDTSFTLVGHA